MADPLDELVRAMTGGGPSDLPRSLVTVEKDALYLSGAGVRAPRTAFTSIGDLALPAGSTRTPIDYFAVYMVIDDYLGDLGLPLDPAELHRAATALVYSQVDRRSLLLGLGLLALVLGRPDDEEAVIGGYRELLADPVRARFDALSVRQPERRVALARQPLLGAFRAALVREDDGGGGQIPPELAALMLSHVVAADFYTGPPDDGDMIGGLPAKLAVDIVNNQGFNSREDVMSLLDRTLRLWRTYGEVGASKIGGRLPADVLADITGLEIEDILSMAFGIWAHSSNWNFGDPLLLNLGLHPDMDPAKWERFLALVAGTPEEFALAFGEERSQWGFLPFQSHPVVRLPDGLLLIDETYLIERVTSGLYWILLDHFRAIDDKARQAWTQAWADMVEAHAEDELRALAPMVLGGGTTFYTEHDLAKAFPGSGGRADATIDFGESLGAFEIVSGQMTTASRIDGDPAAFRKDLEKLIFKKVRQLDGTAKHLLEDASRLTGAQVPPRPVRPVVILGGGLPVNPITVNETLDYCGAENLFAHAMACQVVLIDLGELEMLEGLGEKLGMNPADILTRWQASGIANLSLRNWLLATFGGEPTQYRAARVGERVNELFQSMLHRLGLRNS